MNHKQKFGYMALGALVLAIGIIIGQGMTPSIEAQHNGVFDKITCREIEVVDKSGKPAISLATGYPGNRITLNDLSGKPAISLEGGLGHRITLVDEFGKPAIELSNFHTMNSITLVDYKSGKPAIELVSRYAEKSINVVDEFGKEAISLSSLMSGNRTFKNSITVHDSTGDYAINLTSLDTENSIDVWGKGEWAIKLGSFDIGNRLHVWDKAGNKSFGFDAYPARNELSVYGKPPFKKGVGFYGDSNEAKQIIWGGR